MMAREALPAGWEWATLGQLGRWIGGGTPSKANPAYWTGGTIPWVSPKDMKRPIIEDAEDHITERAVAESSTQLVPTGSVLIVTRSGILEHSVPVAVTARTVALNQDIKALVGNGAVLPGYVAAFIRASQEALLTACSKAGTTVASINLEALKAYPIPLPPLSMQRRILTQLDGLLASGRAARAALDAVPALLEQYRQSVLSAAFRGHLTADWRLLHPHQQAISSVCNADPARRHRTPPAMARPADLPESWSWERLGSLGLDPEGAVQTGPFGAQLHSDEFVADGVPVIAVGNLTGIGFTTDKLYHITTGKAAALARYDVQAGDLLFARSGATLGKVCVAPPEVRDWRMTGHILRARLAQDLIDPQLVAYALWGDPRVTQQVVGGIRGMTRPGYNTALLEAIAIPVPPREEQTDMVTRIRDAFQRIDDVGQLLVYLQERHAALEQATLAKAFRGELVLQDSSDEPADDMLARVREARSTPARAPRRRKAGRP